MKPLWGAAAMAAALAAASPGPAMAAHPVAVVAAENFYGDVARQIGGADITVTSILANPDQDPHLFEASPSVARAVADASVVVYSGIGYDPWMEKLLSVHDADGRRTIVVAALTGHRTGDNPHVWYDPPTMIAYARALAADLGAVDPAHRTAYQHRLVLFEQAMQPIAERIAALRTRLAGVPVTATEPVFGYMFVALGVQVRDMSFQMAVMNDTEPSAADVAAFESDLRTHRVRLLVYNSQATDPIAEHMEKLARTAGIPIVGATETEPPDTSYQAWMMRELDAVDRALPQ